MFTSCSICVIFAGVSSKNKGVQADIKIKTHDKSTNTTHCKTMLDSVHNNNLGELFYSEDVITDVNSCTDDSYSQSEESSQGSTSSDDSSVTPYSAAEHFKNKMRGATLMSISREPKLLLGLPKTSYFCIKLLSESVKATDVHIMITLKKFELTNLTRF